MGINFDSLPTKNPFSVPDIGIYKGVIVKAEMKQPKDPNKLEYLNLQVNLENAQGEKSGVVFDSQYDSDKKLLQYKLGRFVNALMLNLTGNVELKDLAKIILNIPFCVEITQEEHWKNPDEIQAVVKVIGSEIYWPLTEMPGVLATWNEMNEVPGEEPPVAAGETNPTDTKKFDAADGDVPTTPLGADTATDPAKAEGPAKNKY